MRRVRQHLKDGHHKSWNRFSVYLTKHSGHIKELESLLLRIVNPCGNKQSGRFVGSINLKSKLNKKIKETDFNRRAKLVGGNIAERRRAVNAKQAKGSRGLHKLIDRRMGLRAWKDGWEYRATPRKDGSINYGGEIYDTPNLAAKAALGKSCRGWGFWHYRDKNKEWVPLRKLKQ